MTIRAWIIEPRDTMIFRDGRPFGNEITQAVSVDFPFPSTIAGGIRTRAGINVAKGYFDADPSEVKKINSRGTLLARLDDIGEIEELFFPAPADALLMQSVDQKKQRKAERYRLQPMDIAGTKTNLKATLPVGLNRTDVSGKPCGGLRYWRSEHYLDWLSDSGDQVEIQLDDVGIPSLGKDSRFHVAINNAMTNEDGAFFQTRGLDFHIRKESEAFGRNFGLVTFVDSSAGAGLSDKPDVMPLGGERRLVRWRESAKALAITRCPDEIKAQIVGDRHCRLIFLTPAFFNDGHLSQGRSDIDIKAIACNRYETVSGWDFVMKKPKPTARLVPAGSVLFVKVVANDVEKWVDENWFRCFSDRRDEQDFSNDGFGLCLLGAWDGSCLTEWR